MQRAQYLIQNLRVSIMFTLSHIQAEEAPMSIRRFYANGTPGPLTTSMAHVPELLQVAMPFIGAALGPSAIDFRTKEIIILRTSAKMSCQYCTNTHTVVASQTDLTEAQLRALRGEKDVQTVDFSEAELLLIEWCDAMCNGATAISDELMQKLVAQYGEAATVEFALCSGCTLMLNRYASALNLPTADAHIEWLDSNGYQR